MSLIRECTENTLQISVSGTVLIYALAFTGLEEEGCEATEQSYRVQWRGPWERMSDIWGGRVGCTIVMELFGKGFHTVL